MDPIIPAYRQQCVTNLLPALLRPGAASGLPASHSRSGQRVLLILDGLGWEQLQARAAYGPTLAAMAGGPITTVAPSTTAAALTSITTASAPSEHGIVGYKFLYDDVVLNALSWRDNERKDLRKISPPSIVQPYEAFMGRRLPYVSKAEFASTGFTDVHLRGGRLAGYRRMSTMVAQIKTLLEAEEEYIYCYYDGIDKVGHEYGFGSFYDFELAFVDRLVQDILAVMPAGSSLMVSADHGMVDCGDAIQTIAPEVLASVDFMSGEARFRWLHAKAGKEETLLYCAQETYGNEAWVVSIEQVIDEQWLGPMMSDEVRSRCGDVALVPFVPTAYEDPTDSGHFPLRGRHGSLTSAEMYVPCLAVTV